MTVHAVDVTDDGLTAAALELAAKAHGGRIDALVCSAGTPCPREFESMPASEFEAVLRVNVMGCRNAIAATLPHMRGTHPGAGGRIVLVSSQAGQVGLYGFTAYSVRGVWEGRAGGRARGWPPPLPPPWSSAAAPGTWGSLCALRCSSKHSSSSAAPRLDPFPRTPSLQASKFALAGLAQSLGMELHARGVRVSVAFPPDTDTPLLAQENLTKPRITKLLSESTVTVSPEVVARGIVDGMEVWNPAIAVGFDGWMLATLTSGMGPAGTVSAAIVQVRGGGPHA